MEYNPTTGPRRNTTGSRRGTTVPTNRPSLPAPGSLADTETDAEFRSRVARRQQSAYDRAYQEGVEFFGSQKAFQDYLDSGGSWVSEHGPRINGLNEKKESALATFFRPLTNSVSVVSRLIFGDVQGAIGAASAAASQGYVDAHAPGVTMKSDGNVYIGGQLQGNVNPQVAPSGSSNISLWLWLTGGAIGIYLLYRLFR
jgi:hypothetical protein